MDEIDFILLFEFLKCIWIYCELCYHSLVGDGRICYFFFISNYVISYGAQFEVSSFTLLFGFD